MDTGYTPPLALTTISGMFLALGAICALAVAADIIWRRGWQSMMWIMIPVYILNATYMLPVELWVYYKYGRPSIPKMENAAVSHACHDPAPAKEADHHSDTATSPASEQSTQASHHCCASGGSAQRETQDAASLIAAHSAYQAGTSPEPRHDLSANSDAEKANQPILEENMHCHHHDSPRPMYAAVLVGVSHCGAGCVLGDIVGEWLVYGTHATITGEMIWAELLIDYAFALLFGVIFQYFSIAPMSGEWGPKTVWRAFKADVISLTSFQVGLFGWMIAYQVGIFNYRLGTDTWTYWWLMQVGMVLGFGTAMPVNWWLIRQEIKEPCA